jgi:hypothetical protein
METSGGLPGGAATTPPTLRNAGLRCAEDGPGPRLTRTGTSGRGAHPRRDRGAVRAPIQRLGDRPEARRICAAPLLRHAVPVLPAISPRRRRPRFSLSEGRPRAGWIAQRPQRDLNPLHSGSANPLAGTRFPRASRRKKGSKGPSYSVPSLPVLCPHLPPILGIRWALETTRDSHGIGCGRCPGCSFGQGVELYSDRLRDAGAARGRCFSFERLQVGGGPS